MSDQSVVTDFFVRKRSRRPVVKGNVIESSDGTKEVIASKIELLQKTTNQTNKRVTRSSAKQVSRSRGASPSFQEISTKLSKKKDLLKEVTLSPSKRSIQQDSSEKYQSPSKRKKDGSDDFHNRPANPGTKSSKRKLQMNNGGKCDEASLSAADAEIASSSCIEEPSSLKTALKKAESLLAMKQNTPTKLNDTLKKKTNLKELQETLLKMKQLKDKKKKLEEKKKQDASKPKEDSQLIKKKEPAHQRFRHLAQEVPKGLNLPSKYENLLNTFRSTDSVVSMLFNRQETATWVKIQKSVKQITRKDFEKVHLGQIGHVYPTAYKFQQEKGLIYTGARRSERYELTLKPIIDSEDGNFGEHKKLTSALMVERKQTFHHNLLDIVKDHHQKFLSTLEPPIEADNAKIRRWHPEFMLDQIPEPEAIKLPLPPDYVDEHVNSAKDVLEKATGRLTKKAVEALRKVAEKCTPEKKKELVVEQDSNNNKTPPPDPSKYRGISEALLAKVRQKEKDKKLRQMLRTDENEKKLEILKQLPGIARTLRMLYTTERKTSLPVDHITAKLLNCCKSVTSKDSMQERLRALATEIPTWLKIITVRNTDYLKRLKDMSQNEIVQILQSKLAECENKC